MLIVAVLVGSAGVWHATVMD